MKITDIVEAFSDMGNMSDEELQKGQPIRDPRDLRQVDGRVFHQAITTISQNDIARGAEGKGLASLSVYDVGYYNKAQCFLGSNNSSGYAINGGSELVSVFSSQGSSGDAIMVSAVQNGATHLDCFAERDAEGNLSGGLYRLYSKHGFVVDETRNEGNPGEPFAIVNGVSSYVDGAGKVHEENASVVIFMKLG